MLGHACDLTFIQSLPVSHSHSASLPNNFGLNFTWSQGEKVSSVWEAKTGNTVRQPRYTQLQFYSKE